MSLLNVPSNPFPPIFSSLASSLTPPTAPPTPLTGIRLNPCATPLWGGPSGHLADPIPDTGYEPKFCIDVSGEHTPINLPTRNMGFQQEYDGDDHCIRGPQFTSTFRSIKQQPALGKHSSHLVETRFMKDQPHESVSRLWIWCKSDQHQGDLCRPWIARQLFQVFMGLCQRRREIDTKMLCKQWEKGKISTKSLNGKLNWPCEERDWLSKDSTKLRQRSNTWEKRNSDIALNEINQEFQSHRLQLQQANHWADQAQRDKISLYGELEMRNRLFRENQAKDCQEIEESRTDCCEETDRARQARNDELSMHQERNPTTESQLLTQNQDLQNKVNSLCQMREKFTILKLRAALERPTFPSPRSMSCLDSGLPHDARNVVGTWGNVTERLPTREGRTSALFENSKNLASSSHELRPDISGNAMVPERETRRIRQYLYHASKVEVDC